jgi:hypothetical protein
MSALASARVEQLLPGAKGFDINRPLTPALARGFKMLGFEFVFRYIWRDHYRSTDVTPAEIEVILLSGLGVGIVQHAPLPGWSPTADLGAEQATTAILALELLQIPKGVTVAWDLEEVKFDTPAADVVSCGQAFFSALEAAGYTSRCCYVGAGAVLGPKGLGSLGADLYWRAYNVAGDQSPVPRGFAMAQRAAHDNEIPAGFGLQTSDIDVNVVGGDLLGGLPSVLMPGVLA